jgi:BirA family transcriptional regulator, biotin operon repressor / biotin---[acetyl-CoA-carboxylase] ligase
MKRSITTLDKIAALLNDGEFHSGNALGEALSMSRTAIWKHIKFLQDNGFDLQINKQRGYCLHQTPLILLSPARIIEQLSDPVITSEQIFISQQISSTADYIKKLSLRDKPLPYFCLAEQQTQGRGRNGRHWHSPFGQNIYFSSVWHINQDVSQLAGLSLAIGIALIRLLRRYETTDVMLKWPNDIYWRDRKLSGVLIEVMAEANHQCHLFISFGLNVNMPIVEQTDNMSTWTSLYQETGQIYDRNRLVAQAIVEFTRAIEQFSQHGLAAFTEELSHYDYLRGKSVCLSSVNQPPVNGIAQGIDEQGYLILQTGDTCRRVCAGDVSVTDIRY